MSLTASQFKTKIRELSGTTSNDYSDASLIRDLNHELSIINISILRDRGPFEHDDPNHPDLPFATFNILAGQTSYKITRDENGNRITTKHKVAVFHNDRFHDVPRVIMTEGSQAGLITPDSAEAYIPSGYYEAGESIIFTEKPIENTTGKVWFDREIQWLKTADTSTIPGIPGEYHMLACYRTALHTVKGEKDETRILRRITIEEERLETFEENRRGDESVTMTIQSLSGL